MSRDQVQSMIVGALIDQFPSTALVFLHWRMACPGCAVAGFMTVAEAARCYGVPADVMVAELQQAIREDALTRRAP